MTSSACLGKGPPAAHVQAWGTFKDVAQDGGDFQSSQDQRSNMGLKLREPFLSVGFEEGAGRVTALCGSSWMLFRCTEDQAKSFPRAERTWSPLLISALAEAPLSQNDWTRRVLILIFFPDFGIFAHI